MRKLKEIVSSLVMKITMRLMGLEDSKEGSSAYCLDGVRISWIELQAMEENFARSFLISRRMIY